MRCDNCLYHVVSTDEPRYERCRCSSPSHTFFTLSEHQNALARLVSLPESVQWDLDFPCICMWRYSYFSWLSLRCTESTAPIFPKFYPNSNIILVIVMVTAIMYHSRLKAIGYSSAIISILGCSVTNTTERQPFRRHPKPLIKIDKDLSLRLRLDCSVTHWSTR